ncbi:MAG: chemotaxis protein CheB [Chloroflexi bacterium]|nr:chemotaxis protein CheB [Chloroflexota bacterium]
MANNESLQVRKILHLKDPPGKLIIIGSSAGGIQALMTLVGTLPAKFPAPIILAQHFAPDRQSELVNILQKRTPLKVEFIHQIKHIEPGTIYVIPPDYHAFIEEGFVILRKDSLGRPKPSINLLLTTAAHVYTNNVIAVILTGSGSNGAIGTREVKRMGGTVIIENPLTAEFPYMPMAVSPEVVDYKADIEQIGPLLYRLVSRNGLHINKEV